ncbi:hypothetical protein BS47DRAFT_1403002 [Hydnum rufescens UP504]|uniref:Uncharacterized protein n=1 Tax=Hydnum rufescens UP504 TaxID=1448309 RepID=A0A9P6DL34_9AGAM|nr:hypothetical protein BS47DRAFT_1403002 [Hydnum rufescens UP504]
MSIFVWCSRRSVALTPARKKQKVLLAFKSQRRQDLILDRHEAVFSFRYVLDPDYVKMSFSYQTSPSDLATLLEHAPPHQEIGDLRELHPFPPPPGADASLRHYIRYCFLDFYHYPPVVRDCNYPPPQVMDRVDFSTKWLLEALDEVDHAVWQHLAMIVNSHMDRFNHNIVPFWVPLYITGGPYDILVCELAQKAKDSAALGDASVRYSRPSRKCHMEAIGSTESQEWFIQWDSSFPKRKAFDDPSEEPSSSGAQESSKINATSQEPSYPQINIGRCKVDDEANDEVNDETANMEKSGPPGGNRRNKKFRVIASTPSQPPKNRAYIQLESHPKIPEVEYQHESRRSASLLNGTPTSSQVDYPDDPPLLPVQSSEPKRASSTFGYNEEPTVLLSGSHVRPSSVVDISSDDGGSMPESDMPNQLLDEARRIGDPPLLVTHGHWHLICYHPEAMPRGSSLCLGLPTQVDT